MTKPTKSNIAALVDDLGVLKAQIADLALREKAIKDQLVEAGPGAFEGEFYRAAVSVSQRETLDMDAVREKLSPQFIAAHTKVTETVSVRVSARSGAVVAARRAA